MSCLGGLGDAFLWGVVMCAAFVLAFLFNAISFFLHSRPRTIARKLELCLFFIPLAGLLAILMIRVL